MGKTKESKTAVAGKKADFSKTKEGRVAKPVEAIKTKNVQLAAPKQAKSGKTDKASKKAKAPSPEPESESEDESEDASDVGSESGSDSEAETTSKVVKSNGAPANGVRPVDSDDSDSEASDSDEEIVPTKAGKANGVKANGVKAPADVSSDEADSDESESESDNEPAVNGAAKVAAVNGKLAESSADDESDEDSSDGSDEEEDDEDSDDSSEEEVETKKPAAQSMKRKADAVDEPISKKVKVDSDGIKNLFVGNLAWSIDEDRLRSEFESFGEINGCRIITDRDSGRSKGFGYLDYTTAEAAQKALSMKGTEIDGRAINVDLAEPRKDNKDAGANPRDRANGRAQQYGDTTSPPSDTLFIANLSFDTTAEVLQENFSEYGTITRVSLPTHQDSGQMKGFGYIGFTSIDEATAALNAWKGESLLGRPIRVDFSTPKPENSAGGGGFSRGGRGGGRGGFDRGGRGGGRGGFDRGGRGGGRGGFDRGGRGGGRGRGGFSTNRGGLGDFSGKKVTF